PASASRSTTCWPSRSARGAEGPSSWAPRRLPSSRAQQALRLPRNEANRPYHHPMGARRFDLAALLLRLGLAVLFLSFGLDKFARPANVHEQVVNSQLLPGGLAPIFAGAIGFWEVGLGALFLLGLFTPPAALVA